MTELEDQERSQLVGGDWGMKWQNLVELREKRGFVQLVISVGAFKRHQEMDWSLGSIQTNLDIFTWES